MSNVNHSTKTSNEDVIIITDSSNPKSKSYINYGNKLMTNGIVKSRKKTSLKEFSLNKHLRPEVLAGFKVWLGESYFHFDDEWDKLYYDYTHRK